MGLSINLLVFIFLSGLLFSMAVNIPLSKCVHKPTSLVYDFTVSATNFRRHCAPIKPVLMVGTNIPGPEIRAYKNNTVRVNVHNLGNYPVTIHWHGVKNKMNPWHDGPEYVTQCPIQNGSSFSQDIVLSDEIGTLWWHAHSDWSRATVHGPLIVLPPNNSYPTHIKFNCEQTIVLGSWYNGNVSEYSKIASNYLQPGESDAHTINGYVGNFSNGCADDKITFNMTVDKGKTYLLRIVNAVMNEEMFFAIDKHNLTVVGMDGAYVKPINKAYILLGPGNTMDALLKADQKESFYTMAAGPYSNSKFAPFDRSNTTAILMYSGNYEPQYNHSVPDTLPGAKDEDKAADFMINLKNADDELIVPNATVHYNITIGIETDNAAGTRLASLNNKTFQSKQTTSLLAKFAKSFDCSNTTAYTTNFPNEIGTTERTNGTEVICVEWNTTVEIVYKAGSTGVEDHPMHLHGHSFYLVGLGFSNGSVYNITPPPLLNTIAVPKGGWAATRFVANNPGVWFIHCHLERHTSWGMSTALIVKNSTLIGGPVMRPEPHGMPSCT